MEGMDARAVKDLLAAGGARSKNRDARVEGALPPYSLTAQGSVRCPSGSRPADIDFGSVPPFAGRSEERLVKRPKVLNLFAYTGAASLAARAAGADVTHLDSVRQVVTWANGNMERSGLRDIRWVVEDAMKFARREAKRGNRYQGIILDPPAYGHGPDGEKWKLDECLFEMLRTVAQILEPEHSFMVLNLYSNGYSPLLGETTVREAFGLKDGYQMESGELALRDRFGKALPLSIFVRLRR
jgi:23S rRNA (cytosine1962-C5)-methyltransferase